MAKEKLTRAQKAKQLFDAGVRPIETADGWIVLGSKDLYEVQELPDSSWTCNCPDMLYRGHGGSGVDLCKHIQLVRLCQEFDRAVCEMNDAPIANWKIDKHDIHLKKNVVVVF